MEDIIELFARASKLDEDKQGYLTEQEREEWHNKRIVDGVKNFKRRAMGICGSETIKDLDDMAMLLWDTRIVDTLEDGRNLAVLLSDTTLKYARSKRLSFENVRDSDGNKAYKIKSYSIIVNSFPY